MRTFFRPNIFDSILKRQTCFQLEPKSLYEKLFQIQIESKAVGVNLGDISKTFEKKSDLKTYKPLHENKSKF